MCLRPAQIHAQQHLRPVLRFRATGARLNVEVGTVDIHLTREHAPEFQTVDGFFESGQVLDDFVNSIAIVFFDRQRE